ncbi:hypothetical protein D3C85_1179350 [compost metagenome]
MRAVLAVEDADRQLQAGEDAAARQVGLGQVMAVNLTSHRVEHPELVVPLVGAVEVAVLGDIHVVDEREGVAELPFLDFRLRQLFGRTVVMARLNRLAVETLFQDRGEPLLLRAGDCRKVTFHLADRSYPGVMAARGSGGRVAHLVAVVALADKALAIVLP